MIDVNRLRGLIVEQNKSQRQVAKELGISESAFYNKMKRGVFDSDEIEMLISILQIQNPLDIFFVQKVT